jgi:LmbE family N-acetylglucosaminyl deacetylase
MARVCSGLAALAALLLALLGQVSAAELASLRLGNGERLLVVAPHPDDETLGAGGLIQRVRARGGTVQVLVVTAGDGWVEAVRRQSGIRNPPPSQYVAYGEKRLHEVRAAALRLGLSNLSLQVLGFPDGGLDGMLGPHWRRSEPQRSQTTGAANPPYEEVLEPDVPYAGSDLRRTLERTLEEFRPTMVALPEPLDRHPDHRATALFVLIAIDEWLARDASAVEFTPRLLAYLVHWPAWPPGWNEARPRPEDEGAPLPLPADFRPNDPARVALALSEREVAGKRAALAQHKTQRQVMGACLEAFARRTEPFTLLSRSEIERAEYVVAERQRTTRAR